LPEFANGVRQRTSAKFEAHTLEVSVEGQVEKTEGGFRFTRVTIRPLLAIN
jgi:hypothetical protein